MGMAMGENPDIVEEVVGWVKERLEDPGVGEDDAERRQPDGARGAPRCAAGADGIAMINTILSVCGHRPQDAAADADGRGPLGPRRLLGPGGAPDRAAPGDGGRAREPRRRDQRHRRHRDRLRRGAVLPARRVDGAGLHRRDAPRLRDHQRAQGRAVEVHGRPQVHQHPRVHRQEPAVLHDAPRPRRSPEGGARRQGSGARDEAAKDVETWKGDIAKETSTLVTN